MKVRQSCIGFTLFALQVCSSAAAHGSPSSHCEAEAPFPAGPGADLQQTLDQVVAAGVSPGVSLWIERPGYIAWAGVSGIANIRTGAALTTESRTRAGSILKMGVATAVLELVERGRLSLDAPLTELLPSEVTERIAHAGAVTLEMLLNHTSGIPEFADAAFHALVLQEPARVWSFDELLDRAEAMTPVFAPGAGWSYSNTNYLLVGAVIEHATNRPWREAVRHVFARAGLRETRLPEEGDALCDGCARGYEPVNGALLDITDVDPSVAGPAGGDAMITTPADLSKLLAALLGGELFEKASTLDRMLDFIDATDPPSPQTGYGLGIARFQVGNVEFIGHIGSTAGYQAFVFFQPTTKTLVSGYMNEDGNFGAFVAPVLQAVARVETATPSR